MYGKFILLEMFFFNSNGERDRLQGLQLQKTSQTKQTDTPRAAAGVDNSGTYMARVIFF